MNILITNDDGIVAPGIVTLAEALSDIAKVTVIAPDRNNSGVGSGISLEKPLRVMEIRKDWWQLNGTPADCIKLALSGFLNEEPDMVVSGINAGANLSDDVLYSGTVGGALEGRFLRYPSLAVSCVGESDWQFETAAYAAVEVVKKQIHHAFVPEGVILNMNVPNVSLAEFKGIKIVRLGDRHFSEPLTRNTDGRGKTIYWMGAAGKVKDGGAGTDFHAVHNGYASLTPLQVDLTAHEQLNPLQKWFDQGA